VEKYEAKDIARATVETVAENLVERAAREMLRRT
jgi:cobalamin biosynthesis protein CobD/CbiB